MPTKKPYMQTTERGYHPAEWFIPVILEIVNHDYKDHVKPIRSKSIKEHYFPIVVLRGPLDILRELEYRYDTKVRGMFPEMVYDDLKRLTTDVIEERYFAK